MKVNNQVSFLIKNLKIKTAILAVVAAGIGVNAYAETPYNFDFSVQGNQDAYPVEVFSNNPILYLEFPDGVSPISIKTSEYGYLEGTSFHNQSPYITIDDFGKKTVVKTNKGTISIINNSIDKSSQIPDQVFTSSKTESGLAKSTTMGQNAPIDKIESGSVKVAKPVLIKPSVSKPNPTKISSLVTSDSVYPSTNINCDKPLINIGTESELNNYVNASQNPVTVGEALNKIIPTRFGIKLSKKISKEMQTTYASGPWQQSLKRLNQSNAMCAVVDWNNNTVFENELNSQILHASSSVHSSDHNNSAANNESLAPTPQQSQLTVYTFSFTQGLFSHQLRTDLKKYHLGLAYLSSENMKIEYPFTIEGNTLLSALDKLGKATGYRFVIHSNVITAKIADNLENSNLVKGE